MTAKEKLDEIYEQIVGYFHGDKPEYVLAEIIKIINKGGEQ